MRYIRFTLQTCFKCKKHQRVLNENGVLLKQGKYMKMWLDGYVEAIMETGLFTVMLNTEEFVCNNCKNKIIKQGNIISRKVTKRNNETKIKYFEVYDLLTEMAKKGYKNINPIELANILELDIKEVKPLIELLLSSAFKDILIPKLKAKCPKGHMIGVNNVEVEETCSTCKVKYMVNLKNTYLFFEFTDDFKEWVKEGANDKATKV